MVKRKNNSVEIIADPKRIKKISVITTTIAFVESEDIQNVKINPEDYFEDEDSEEDVEDSEEYSEEYSEEDSDEDEDSSQN